MRNFLAYGLSLLLSLIPVFTWADMPSLRPTYGQSPFPIWSELSYFENDTLSLRHRAEQNEPDALLAFYMLASGMRNLADYENSQRRVKAFIEGLPSDLRRDSDLYRQAERLHQLMHQHFFVTPDSHQKGGYDDDQSAIAAIFSTGQFNCISSTMLYIVLARHLDFASRAAILPSHVFVEINLGENRRAEVETTSPAGFGVSHDEAFYQAAAGWFKERGLRPSSLQDYQNRQLISPLQLAALSMLTQHTSAQHMSRTDSVRLGEISAFLDPTNPIAQSRRLQFYSSEVEALSQHGAWYDLLRMYAATLADLRQIQPLFADNKNIQHSIYWLHTSALFAYANTGKLEGYKTQINTLQTLPNHSQERSVFEAALLDSSAQLFEYLAHEKQFEEAILFSSSLEEHLKNNRGWGRNIALLYNLWSIDRWQQQDWPGVVDVLDEYFAQPYQDSTDPTAKKNLTNAYRNWFGTYLVAGDWAGAKSVVESCTTKKSTAFACGELTALLKTAMSLKK
ncbi:MAG TPA: hypothetical protein VIZ65_06825 [Cellvibrionaceae bacterium]